MKLPDFLPAAAQQLSEPSSIDLAQRIQRLSVPTPLCDAPIPTAFAHRGKGATPIWLLHGFDSSLLEFRRLMPHLAAQQETWAVDLLGFGFSDRTISPSFDPAAIKLHLHSFWQQQIQRPVVLVGASMGG
ncbi:MAG: alpha/beta fold hydrolase, partial [Cyanobacteria bacterium P01_D01_bin.128]